MARKPPPPDDSPENQANRNGDQANDAGRAGRGGNIPPPSSRWRPGASGNPLGRPKIGQSITSLLREAMLSRTLNGSPIDDGRTVADLIVETAINKAIEGEFTFFKEIVNRLDGKIADKLTVDDMRKLYDVVTSPESL